MDEFGEYRERKKIYQTVDEYIRQEVRPAAAASGVELTEEVENSIASAMLEWHDDVRPDGNINLGGTGYREVGDEETFWKMVEDFVRGSGGAGSDDDQPSS